MPPFLLTGVLPRAAASVLPRLLKGLEQRRDKKQQEVVAQVLNPQRLTASLSVVSLDWPPSVPKEAVRRFLDAPEASGVVQELLTFRLAAPAGERPDRIRDTWLRTGAAALDRPGDDSVTTFLDKAFTALDEQCTVIATDVRETYPGIAADIRQRAEFRRMANVLEAIEEHNRSLTTGGDPLATNRVLAQYRRQVARAHGHLEPPDFETRRQVAIDLLYVSPTFHTAERGPKVTLEQLEAALDRTVVLGNPGAGKSTAAQVLTHRTATRPDGLIPFIVVLREFAQSLHEHSVVEYLERRARAYYQCELPAGLTGSLLLAGKALVIFDGLDELVDTRMRRQVTDVVGLFCERFPLAPVLITSRAVGYDQAPMDPASFTTFQIAEFTDADVEEYVRKWFAQQTRIDAAERERLAATFIRESRVSPDLRTNPLMLALLCILYRGERYIPRNRPAVYEKCANLLFEQWDSSRQIFVALQAGHMVDPAVKHLAHWMLTHEEAQEGVTERALIAETSRYLRQRTFEDDHRAESAARDFVAFCRGRGWVFTDIGTDADGEPLYQFTHRTFLEYFAAYHLTRTHNTPEAAAAALQPRIANGEWDMVGQLVVQIIDRHSDGGADRLLAAMLTDDSPTAVLAFACRCLAVVSVSPALARRITATAFELYLRNSHDEPLKALIAAFNSHNVSIVCDEFVARLRVAVTDGDLETRKHAVYFMIHDFLQVTLGRDISDDEATFWRERFAALGRTLGPTLHNIIMSDGRLKVAALYNGWITFEEFIDDGYAAFFRNEPLLRGNGTFYSPVERLLGIFWFHEDALPWRANLDAFVAALNSTHEAPWHIMRSRLDECAASGGLIPYGSLAGFDPPQLTDASPDQRFGLAAAFLMLIEAESALSRVLVSGIPEPLPDFLARLMPFVEQRRGTDREPLAPPEGIANGEVIVAWARNEMSFLDIQD